jgi:phenylpropionate dioxygenase-like ring-hydroxylating dioxygenase large terminal subunit
MTTSVASGTFPIALQRDIQPASIVRTKFMGIELIAWRDNDDRIHVWQDRCPHRSVKLSAGRNLGDCIQGAYHGWKFGKDGSVSDIPAEGHAQRTDIRVRTFPCRVVGGFVWIDGGGESSPPKAFAAAAEDDYLHSIYVKAPDKVVAEALSEVSEFQLWITPCDDALSLILGYGRPRGGESSLEMVRRGNHLLNRIRRAVESGRGQ